MHAVVETPAYLVAAKDAGLSPGVRAEIVTAIANDPTIGDLIVGSHGLRKFRHAKPGTGKSGGYRVITYFYSAELPVFLITVFGKNQKSNLSRAEATALGGMVKTMATNYRKRAGK